MFLTWSCESRPRTPTCCRWLSLKCTPTGSVFAIACIQVQESDEQDTETTAHNHLRVPSNEHHIAAHSSSEPSPFPATLWQDSELLHKFRTKAVQAGHIGYRKLMKQPLILTGVLTGIRDSAEQCRRPSLVKLILTKQAWLLCRPCLH